MAVRLRIQTAFSGVLPAAIATIVAICGLFVLVMTLRLVLLAWTPVPYWDQWDNLITGRSLTWTWLASQQNEHRLFVPRLVFWLDRWLAAETNRIDLAVNILIQAALAALLPWLALKDVVADRSTKVWAAGLCLAFLFWAIQYENFAWGFQVQFFGVVLFAAIAFAIVAIGPATGLGLVAAALASGAAAYTLASGILVPPLALLLGLWVRRPRWYVAGLLIAAIAWPVTYLWGYRTPDYHSNPADLLANLKPVGFFFLVELGGPFLQGAGHPEDFKDAAIVGAAGLALYAAGVAALARRSSEADSKRALAMLGLFLLGAAFLTAAGRVRFGPAQAFASRYATPVLVFWLSSFLLCAALSRTYLRLAIIGGTTALAAFIAVTEPGFVAEGLNWTLGRKLATPALITGVPDALLSNVLQPARLDFLLQHRRLLLSGHTSIFAEDWTRLMGARFTQFFTVDEKAPCSGSFDSSDPVDETMSGWRGIGTAWMKGGKALSRIVLVDNQGRIAGYGLGGFEPDSVGAKPESDALSGPVWWIGDFIGAEPSQISAYAVYSPAGACFLGSNPRRSPRLVALGQLPDPAPERGGYVDAVSSDDAMVIITGWGFLSSGDGRVMIDTDLPVRSMTLVRQPRPDVVNALHDASLKNAGVEAHLLLRSTPKDSERHRLCVWTDDPAYGRRLLHDASEAGRPPFACGAKAVAPPDANPAAAPSRAP